MAAISCRGVVKRFHLFEQAPKTLRGLFIQATRDRTIRMGKPYFALTDFDLDVQCGEAVALIGANGSGKSTALRVIAGIYKPTTGNVVTVGRVATVISLGAGFHPELTGSENILLYGMLLGLGRQDVRSRIEDIVAFAEVGDFIEVPLKYYSSGMQARLAFAVAVCSDPDILLLDEVLAVGDERFRTRCLERIQAFHERGGTLLIASHDLATMRSICTRAVWLAEGCVRQQGAVDEVVDGYLAATQLAAPVAARA